LTAEPKAKRKRRVQENVAISRKKREADFLSKTDFAFSSRVGRRSDSPPSPSPAVI
jgi:hypothetical protein